MLNEVFVAQMVFGYLVIAVHQLSSIAVHQFVDDFRCIESEREERKFVWFRLVEEEVAAHSSLLSGVDIFFLSSIAAKIL